MMSKDITIREIAYGSEPYTQALKLRNDVLRVPLGLSLFDEDMSDERGDTHIAATVGSSVAGILVLTDAGGGTVQMRQVAVREQLRGSGIGRAMVTFAEQTAHRKGYREMMLHARDTAVGFYSKLGYSARGTAFTEVGIVHREMVKRLV